MMNFKEIDVKDIKDNPFKLIGDEWMLLTSGKMGSFNAMTASWGTLGVLWEKNVCHVFVRPVRYTYEFMEKNEYFSLSFFEEKEKHILEYCGEHSGREVNKVKETGLKPFQGKYGILYEQARLSIECKKIYCADIDPKNFLDKKTDDFYPKKDYHRMYAGEILNAWIKV
jgi:flavin reductase (DIM6/NTAB) family NADH-FMN oxidoreductase RutF